MKGGYNMKVLYVDLTSGNHKERPLDVDYARKYIGDMGINLRLMYDLLDSGIGPFSPLNPIVFGAGPLVGTRFNAQRWTVASKLPLTGAVNCASGGMRFGVRLKLAGYDHLVITGRSPKPTYLKISNNKVDICDAEYLWGKDIYETTDYLWGKIGRDYSIYAIGQAGENLVKISLGLVDKIASCGKGGLAAVMGSKNLKAVAIKGNGKVPIADEDRFREVSNRIIKVFKDDPNRSLMVKLGKMRFWEKNLAAGFAYKNWNVLYPREKADQLFGVDTYLKFLKKRVGCSQCPYPCKDILEVRDGTHKGLVTYAGSIIGRIRDLGLRCDADNFSASLKLLDIFNRFGVCTHCFVPIMDFAIELYQRGLITDKDTNGMVLKHGFDTALKLVNMVAFRQGIGDILADGNLDIIRKFGQACARYSVCIKGLNTTTDARTREFNMGVFEQVVNPEGANTEPAHVGLGFMPSGEGFSKDVIKNFGSRMGIPQESMDKIFNVKTYYNVGRALRYAEDFFSLLTSLGICDYRTTFFDWGKLGDVYSAATGNEVTAEDMKLAGERIWNLFKTINLREGFDRKDDTFPEKWFEPIRSPEGKQLPLLSCSGEEVTVKFANRLLDDYYDERGWDIVKGIPTVEKLNQLEMEDIAADLQESGVI